MDTTNETTETHIQDIDNDPKSVEDNHNLESVNDPKSGEEDPREKATSSHNEMDVREEESSSQYISLDHAMKQRLKLSRKLLKAIHHAEFLQSCLDAGRIPKGLRIQFQEIHMMDSPSISKTRSNLAAIYKESERNICKALIEHYKEIQTETERQINHTEKAIDSHVHKDAETSATYNTYLEKLERNQDNVRSLLQNRRKAKLARLTPRTHTSTPRTHLHTYTPHSDTSSSRTRTPHTPSSHTRTLPTRTLPTHTPSSHTRILPTHTLSPQGPTHGKKTLGAYPGSSRKGKGPSSDYMFTPYRRPVRNTVPASIASDRPSLLPLPTMGVTRIENPPGPVDHNLDDIRTTLNELVSVLKYSIERKFCQYDRLSDVRLCCLNESRSHSSIQPLPPTAYDIPGMYNSTCNRVNCPFDPPLGTQTRQGHPSFPPIICGRPIRCNMACNEVDNPLGHSVRMQLAHKRLAPPPIPCFSRVEVIDDVSLLPIAYDRPVRCNMGCKESNNPLVPLAIAKAQGIHQQPSFLPIPPFHMLRL